MTEIFHDRNSQAKFPAVRATELHWSNPEKETAVIVLSVNIAHKCCMQVEMCAISTCSIMPFL